MKIKNGQPFSFQAFSLVEILALLAISLILVALIFPALQSMRDKASSTTCLNNLRSLSAADMLYATDHDGRFVPVRNGGINQSTIWLGNAEFRDYLGLKLLDTSVAAYSPKKFICPKANLALTSSVDGMYNMARSYAYNVTGTSYANPILQFSLPTISKPSRTIHMCCSTDWWVDAINYAGAYLGEIRPPIMTPAYRHADTVNVVFFDGHTESLPRSFVLENLDQWIIK